MWKTWQPTGSPLRFPSPISYNASGLVLFFRSDWTKTPSLHLGHKPAFFLDWFCLVKPGFLAKRGARYLDICLSLRYLFVWFYSNTGSYLRIAIIKYVHVTHRECYKYTFVLPQANALLMISLGFCLPSSGMYRWTTTETAPKPMSQLWTRMLQHLGWWRQQQSCDGSSGVSYQEAAGLQEQEALAKTFMVWDFSVPSLHHTVFLSTLSKRLNLKDNVRNQSG